MSTVKLKKIVKLLSVCLLVVGYTPMSAQAETSADLKKQESAVEAQAEQIDAEINTVIAEVNKKYEELADLEIQKEKSLEKIKKTQEDISITRETIEDRKESAAKRMQTIQLSSASASPIETLLSSENVSDFISRMYAVSMIQGSNNSKISSLVTEQEKLVDLEASLKESEKKLEKQETQITTDKAILDKEVANLQAKYDENKQALANLTAKRVAKEDEERQVREEQARKAKEAQAAADKKAQEEAEAAKVEENNSSSQTQNTPESEAPSSNDSGSTGGSSNNNNGSNNNGGSTGGGSVVTPPTSGGTNGQATAYVATGNKTATGTVPTPGRTIAVDPSVIPLGSLVRIEVPSMPQYSGVYRAEDTGGAVKGNIIDIFVGSDSAAIIFGRRAIKFTVL